MREISLHILDIAENGITAGADVIRILVDEQRARDQLEIAVVDNGKGIPEEMIDKVIDPFVTSRTTRRVGLGLSLLKAAAERCDGTFELTSKPGAGAKVTATFRYSHIDRAPLGNMAESMGVLVIGNPDIDFVYTHQIDAETFELNTQEIRRNSEALSRNGPKMFQHVMRTIREAVDNMEKGAGRQSP